MLRRIPIDLISDRISYQLLSLYLNVDPNYHQFHPFRQSHLIFFSICSDFSRNQRWRRQEAPGCRDLHLQWPHDAHEEGLLSISNSRPFQIMYNSSIIPSVCFWTYLQSLTGIKGLSEAKVDKICEAAEKIVV